jgi:hypothetical protein
MRTLIQIAIVVLLVWWACKWWKKRQQARQVKNGVVAALAALGASTRVGSDLGSSASVASPPMSEGYGQAVAPPTGGPPVTNGPSSIFSGCCN